MANEEILVEMSRTLGRIESRLDNQDRDLADLKTDLADLKATPARRRKALLKWASGIAATIIAAIVLAAIGH